MTFDDLARLLRRRAPAGWELYFKSSRSRERESAREMSRISHRVEEGWAVRWWQGDPAELRFAASSSAEGLVAAMEDAGRIHAAEDAVPHWPPESGRRAPGAEAHAPLEDPPDLGPALSSAIASASGGAASLAGLSLRAGETHERIANSGGLDVERTSAVFDGLASAIARKGSSARAARVAFRWDPRQPDVENLGRRLANAASLPLSDRAAPFRAGQWLLEPPVAAAILAAVAPAFCGPRGPSWLSRAEAAAPGLRIVDDASPEAPWDGEGVSSRRMLLVESGEVVSRLYDLRTARAAGRTSTGHGVRPSFREPPRCGPRRIFFEARDPTTSDRVVEAVKKGLAARALTAPVRVNLAADRYEVEFTGASVIAGREQGPVAGARASGRISELLRRIEAAGSNLEFFPAPFLAGSPTLLVEKTSFD